ncbi:Multidrug resistance-associated protein 14 [Heracleum sosnowskyi]|uniref:Multidrug resistance-associated protein 14 n=1 Tax=Heracleum sosnowskyi TaxID=360622 RepID=A0AAD8H7A8_9APIA|nr:Multidrug resistance-associated protein 14 [Heracleum sosnowskyi]
MSAICISPLIRTTKHSSSSCISRVSSPCYPFILTHCPHTLSSTTSRTQKTRTRTRSLVLTKCSDDGKELTTITDEWLTKLPEKNKPIYAHSLPCLEAWLKSLGFYQSKDDRAVWFVDKSDWHAHLSLDVTDLHIRYLRTGPGNLDKDVERRFSYALSREDIENAILGGP